MSLEARITRLENENRSWKLASLIMAAFIALMLACSNSSTDQRVVAAASGTRSASFDTLSTKQLLITEDSGRSVGRIMALNGGAVIHFWRADEPFGDPKSSQIEIGTDQESMPRVIVAHEGLSTLTSAGGLLVGRASGEEVSFPISLALTQGGGGSLTLRNTLGDEVVTLQADKANGGLLLLKDATGKVTGGLPL